MQYLARMTQMSVTVQTTNTSVNSVNQSIWTSVTDEEEGEGETNDELDSEDIGKNTQAKKPGPRFRCF